jgi:DNA-dependent RNA polymerase auxiliary subunit epsilon
VFKKDLMELKLYIKSLSDVDIRKVNESRILFLINKIERLKNDFAAYESNNSMLSYDYLKLKLDYEKLLLDFKKIKHDLNLEIKVKINNAEWIEFKEKAAKKDLTYEQILRIFIHKFNDNPDLINELIKLI